MLLFTYNPGKSLRVSLAPKLISMDNSKSNKPWYFHWWGALIALLFLPFFVIWLIWTKTNWSKRAKGLATIGVLILFFTLGSGYDKGQVEEVKNNLEKTNENLKQTSQKLEEKIEERTQPTIEEKTWEEKLAQLDTNNPNPDPATVQVFHRQLVKLTAMCEENDQWVSDRIVQGQNALKKRGVEATLQEIGQGFDDAVVELPDKTCEEAFATYLTGKATGQL